MVKSEFQHRTFEVKSGNFPEINISGMVAILSKSVTELFGFFLLGTTN